MITTLNGLAPLASDRTWLSNPVIQQQLWTATVETLLAELRGHDAEAFICSFECTWCAACATSLSMKCLNCGGELVRRPVRPAEKLAKNPPSTKRVVRDVPCPPGA